MDEHKHQHANARTKREEKYPAALVQNLDRQYRYYFLSPRFLFRDRIFKNLLSCFPPIAAADSPANSFFTLLFDDGILNRAKLNRLFYYTQLKANFQAVTSILWPLAFSITTLHDLIHYYQYPEDRYNYPLLYTLSGFAPIEASWNYHFGADLVSDSRWPWAFALFAPFPIMWLMTRIQHRVLNDIEFSYLLEEHNQCPSKFFPWSDYAYVIERSVFPLLWGNKDSKNTVQTLCDLTDRAYGLIYYQTVLALTNIVDGIPDRKIAQVDKQNTEAPKKRALEKLQKLSREAPGFLTRLFVTYQLWTLNQPTPSYPRVAPLFWLLAISRSLLTLVSSYHAFRLLGRKSYEFIDHYIQKTNCEAQDKIFRCLNQIEDCICALCADWAEASTADHTPSIHYSLSDNPQACLNALLSDRHMPDYLLATLPRLLGRLNSNVRVFDASLQETSSWTEAEWDALLTLLENLETDLKVLNLSHPHPSGPSIPFSINQLKRLNTLLNQIQLEQLDISRQNLEAIRLSTLVENLHNLSWRVLNVSRNQLGDAGISILANLLPNATRLTALTLSSTQMTDDGARLLSATLNQSIDNLDTLTYLDLSNNLARENGLAELLSLFNNHSLISLDVSDIPLTPPVFAALSSLLPQLRQFSGVNSAISDVELDALFPTNWTIDCRDKELDIARYDLSNNQFGNAGAERLFAALPPRQNCSRTNNTQAAFSHPAIAIALRHTQISDALLPTIVNALREKYIVGLQLDGTLVTTSGLTSVLSDFCQPQVFLSELSTADIALSADTVASELAALLKNSTCKERLTTLDMSHTGLTEVGALELLSALPNTRLKKLSLANNPLTSTAVRRLNQTQYNASLTALDLSNTLLDKSAVDSLLTFASEAAYLLEFRLSHNPLGAGAGIQLAQMLLAPQAPRLDQLSEQEAPRDLKRLLGFQKPLERLHLTPRTSLQVLDLGYTDIDTSDARALCRVSYRAGLFVPRLSLENNPVVKPSFVNPRTCEISSAHSVHANTELLRIFALVAFLWFLPALLNTCRSRPRKKRAREKASKAEQSVASTASTNQPPKAPVSSSSFFQPEGSIRHTVLLTPANRLESPSGTS